MSLGVQWKYILRHLHMKIEIIWIFHPNYYADNEICNGNCIELDLWMRNSSIFTNGLRRWTIRLADVYYKTTRRIFTTKRFLCMSTCCIHLESRWVDAALQMLRYDDFSCLSVSGTPLFFLPENKTYLYKSTAGRRVN